MDAEELLEQVARLAAVADKLPEDLEDRVGSLGLEPTLHDRTLLLIEQTRMLAERSSRETAKSDRLRDLARQPQDDASRAGGSSAVGPAWSRREATAGARDDVLDEREATALAREDTLTQREEIAAAQQRRLQRRETAAENREARLRARERRVQSRAEALDRQESNLDASRRQARLHETLQAEGPASLVDAFERGWRAAQQTVDPSTDPTQFEREAFERTLAELQEALPHLIEGAIQRWIGHAHHELRRPLTVIEGTAETLHQRDAQLDDATRGALLARLRRQSMLMQRIIDQLGQATQLQSGALSVTPEQTDLRSLVEQLVDDYRPLLDEVAVDYDRPTQPVPACVEPSAAAEILLVLLRNAVEHAPCERPILVETVTEATHTRLSVHDDGEGIAAADRERAFDYGTQLDDTGTLGLGLFIARGLARAHGGDLTVNVSEHLGGARFDVNLPTRCDDPIG